MLIPCGRRTLRPQATRISLKTSEEDRMRKHLLCVGWRQVAPAAVLEGLEIGGNAYRGRLGDDDASFGDGVISYFHDWSNGIHGEVWYRCRTDTIGKVTLDDLPLPQNSQRTVAVSIGTGVWSYWAG